MREQLQAQRVTLIDYLLSKVKSDDFHAVQDAASDIREIDAKLSVLPKELASNHVHEFVYYIENDSERCRCGAVRTSSTSCSTGTTLSNMTNGRIS